MISEKEAADFLALAGRCDGGLSQTLVISAREDPLAPYRIAAAAVARIAGGRLGTVELGGHLFSQA
ncbi:MAG TPA: alpha/beta hydrolase [Streptosporangiaceae bacterium]|nr:alpha/beta hydrolase [Streptosporangiaceae bacterium]